jgi:nucleotide-binding universal stress UspA family protein
MFKRILIAYDGSEPADKAFERALDLASKYGAHLHVLAVAQPPEFAEDVETEAVLDNARDHFEARFTSMKQRAVGASVEADFEIRVGHPAEQVVRFADQRSVDLIVTGHRGKGLFERWLLGSVSRRVIAYAGCTVMVVR